MKVHGHLLKELLHSLRTFAEMRALFVKRVTKKGKKNHIKKDFLEKVNTIKLVDWENLDYKAFAKKFYIRYFSGKMPY